MSARMGCLTLLLLTLPSAHADGPGDSVIKVYATVRDPDLLRPWAKQNPLEVTGSGVVIEGKQILTNAHVVLYATEVFVQGREGGEKIEAKIKSVGPGIDLAVLTVDNQKFFEKRPPLPRVKDLPLERTAVEVYGYPIGGNNLSITKGIVSRIEFATYNYQTLGLRVQIDAAVNPGNSGGPTLTGNQMIGLTFSRLNAGQNIGYIIPNEEIEAFLREPATKPWVSGYFQALQNDTLRKKLGLDEKAQGILASKSFGPLQKFDIITHAGTHELDNQGQVKVGDHRFYFQYLVPTLAKDGKVPFTVIRAGKTLKVDLPVTRGDDYVIRDLKGEYPSYFLYGPLVFAPATMNAVLQFGRLNLPTYDFSSPLFHRRDDKVHFEGEELVLVTAPMLRHKCVRGYQDPLGRVVQDVNNIKIKNLRHLVEVLRDSQDEFISISFAGERAEVIVLNRKDMPGVTQEVMDDNGIPRRGSQDLVELWNQKKTKNKK